MFVLADDGSITMHRGDTGAILVKATKKNGEAWTADDRMIFTIRNQSGEIVLQRFYRLDTDAGNGFCLIQFHNNDTDEWENGQYFTERRYVINPKWDGDAPTGDAVDALNAGVRMIDGDTVRVPENGQSSLTINDIYGEV